MSDTSWKDQTLTIPVGLIFVFLASAASAGGFNLFSGGDVDSKIEKEREIIEVKLDSIDSRLERIETTLDKSLRRSRNEP
tara:strand:- start:949 stop:1188 length:240 start_codon:yes stop_codon:yes gene_type:complete